MLHHLKTTSIFYFLFFIGIFLISGRASANNAPTTNGTIPAQTVNVGGSAATVDVSSYFSDPDSDTLTYTASSSDTAKATVSVSSATVSITAVAVGTATITVTATDPGNLTATQTIAVSVPNRAPVATTTLPDQTVTVGTYATIKGGDYFSDPDGDSLGHIYDFSQSEIELKGHVIPNGVAITGAEAGIIRLTVTVSDPGGLTAAQSCTITVTAGNSAPAAVGTIPAQTVDVGGSATTIDVSSYFSDPDSDTLTYTASSSDTAKATVSVSSATVSITAVAAGSATITVTATDPGSLTATQTFSLTVNPQNNAPTTNGTIPDETLVTDGETAQNTRDLDVSGYFSDPDGDTLTYTASSSDTGKATVSVSSSTVTLTAVATGTATITVTATDPGGLTATQTFSLAVNPPATITSNQSQTADAVPGLSTDEQLLLGRLLTFDTLIINALYNASNDTDDWLELRNVSASDLSLDDWQLTIQTREGPVVVTFPAGTVIPADGVLLLVNTESGLPDTAAASLLSVVSKAFRLPQQDFALILRSPTAFGDVAGNYFEGAAARPERVPAFSVDTVWDRIQPSVAGYRAGAWAASTSEDGLGTPGYQQGIAASVDPNGDGVVNILDLVFVGGQIGQPADGNTADVNADGTVDVRDLVLVAAGFSASTAK